MLSDSDRAVIKGQIAALGGVKLVASVLTLYYFPSWHAVLIVGMLSLPWFIAGGYYLGRSTWLRYRFWKYRHLRKRLLREEWHLDEDAPETVTGDRKQET
ncbi:MAG: hypothetical protein R3A46_20730 [Thermomicrobiales bacterium]